MKNVYVSGGDKLVIDMFEKHGWTTWHSSIDACQEITGYPPDLICFTGGADVNPKVYGEEPNGARGWNDRRDEKEVSEFNLMKGKVPFVGICRGGQLLNVLNGGKMIQDHGLISGTVETLGGREVLVDHHQGIRSSIEAEDIDWKYTVEGLVDYAAYYGETYSLCFQPHPEWGHEGTEKWFFDLIEEYFNEI